MVEAFQDRMKHNLYFSCGTLSDGHECALGDVLAVRVKPEWFTSP